MTDYLTPDDERGWLDAMYARLRSQRLVKRRLEFERRLYAVCRIRTQNGICLN